MTDSLSPSLLDWDGLLWRVCDKHRVRWPVASHAKNAREWEEHHERMAGFVAEHGIPVEVSYDEMPAASSNPDDPCPGCMGIPIPAAFRGVLPEPCVAAARGARHQPGRRSEYPL